MIQGMLYKSNKSCKFVWQLKCNKNSNNMQLMQSKFILFSIAWGKQEYRPSEWDAYKSIMVWPYKLRFRETLLKWHAINALTLVTIQPLSQGHFPGLGAGREKALPSAGHVSILHPEILGVII